MAHFNPPFPQASMPHHPQLQLVPQQITARATITHGITTEGIPIVSVDRTGKDVDYRLTGAVYPSQSEINLYLVMQEFPTQQSEAAYQQQPQLGLTPPQLTTTTKIRDIGYQPDTETRQRDDRREVGHQLCRNGQHELLNRESNQVFTEKPTFPEGII